MVKKFVKGAFYRSTIFGIVRIDKISRTAPGDTIADATIMYRSRQAADNGYYRFEKVTAKIWKADWIRIAKDSKIVKESLKAEELFNDPFPLPIARTRRRKK